MPLRKSTGSVAKKMRLCGVSCSMIRPPKSSARWRLRTRWRQGVKAQTGAIGALQLRPRWSAVAEDAAGSERHFDKAWRRAAGCRMGINRAWPCAFSGRLARDPQMLSHTGMGQHPGQGHGLIPEGLGNAFARMRTGLTPVLELAGELVELVIGV